MCEPNSTSDILSGHQPAISSAPPLILLQSEDDSASQDKLPAADTAPGVCGEGEGVGPLASGDTSVPWPGADSSESLPAAPLPHAWSLDNESDLPEDKILLTGLTEEHLQKLEAVLSSEEAHSLLQHTHLAGELGAESTSGSRQHQDSGQLSDDSLRLDLFDSQASDPALNIDQALAHHFIQDSVREHELAVMAAAFSDHAYALPSSGTESTSFSPRKSARIKQRMDDGKNAFESDSDFEYYFTPSRRQPKKEATPGDQSDAGDKGLSSPASSSSPATSTGRGRPPKRRSTRIVDMENREKAEKILQENRQKEQEAKAAWLKQKEEEEAKVKDESLSDASHQEKTPMPQGKKGKQLMKKSPGSKGQKKGGAEAAGEEHSAPEEREESDDGSKTNPEPKAKKKLGKKLQKAKKPDRETDDHADQALGKGGSPKVPGKKKKPGPKPGGDKKGGGEGERPLKKKKTPKGPPRPGCGSGTKNADSSSDEDDLPLQAIARAHKSPVKKGEKLRVVGSKKLVKKAASRGMSLLQKQVVQKRMKLKKQGKHGTASAGGEGKGSASSSHSHGSAAHSGAGEATEKGADKAKDPGGGVSVKSEESSPSVKATKHKHRKSEEIIIDPSVTDLFKPDGVIPNEHLTVKKEGDSVLKKEGDGVLKKESDGALKKESDGALKKESDGALKKESDGADHASKEGKDPGFVAIGVKVETAPVRHVTKSLLTDARLAQGGGSWTKVKVGESASAETSAAQTVRAPKSSGSAGAERPGFAQQISLLTNQVVKPPSTTGASPSSKPPAQQKVVYVTLKADKGKVQVIHSQHKPATAVLVGQKSDPSQSNVEVSYTHSGEGDSKTEKHPKSERRISHSEPKDEKKAAASGHREERRSLFEVLGKPDDSSKMRRESGESGDSGKKKAKKRKHSAEKHAGVERSHSKDDGHMSGDLSYEDDENDSDWEPVNDTETLYCICKKPHGNRFMICCDQCGEWYHGQCVGVSKQQGQQLEKDNKDYVCPPCAGDSPAVKPPVEKKPAKHQEEGKPKLQEEGKAKPKEKKDRHSTESRKRSRDSLDEPRVFMKVPAGPEKKWKPGRCVANECKRRARLGSVFCGKECIVRHAQDSLRSLRYCRQRLSGQPVADARPSETRRVMVVEPRSGRMLRGEKAPTEAQLELWLETHPSFHVLQPRSADPDKKPREGSRSGSSSEQKDRGGQRKGSVGQKSSHDPKDKGRRESLGQQEDGKGEAAGAKREEDGKKAEEGASQMRSHVRKSLRDALSTRAKEADDVKVSSGDIKHIAVRIEDELFKVFENTGHKFMAKFRSLLFNIKDQKNKILFRKILLRKIRSSHLVRMSSEELASKELARWRKRENKHTLAMIEQTEKEAMKEGQQHIRKKTHKGEVEVEDEDMSTLVTHMEEQKKSVETKGEESAPSVVVDTTDQHRAHLFDLNCKICTGRVLPPAEQEPTPSKVKVAHTVHEEKKEEEKEQRKKKGVRIKSVKIVEDDSSVQTKAPDVATTPSSTPSSSSTPQSVSTPPSLPTSTPQVTVRSPDSALQSGLEAKHKFLPSGPMVWKGFVSMQDFAKFFTSAYRVSGPAETLGLPDSLQICGRIGPDQMWDYLGKIRQAGSRDMCILRFIPGSDDEKVAYVHLYSYLNSRSRCGVVGNAPKHIKDLYIVPLASHNKIPQVLLPFDGPGLEGNRPHMLIGIVVRQKSKRSAAQSQSHSPSVKPKTSQPAGAVTHDVSTTKKGRVSWGGEETEAYDPTADADNDAGTEALYIPTPTVAPVSGNAASAKLGSGSVKGGTKTEDLEPYSPSKEMEVDDEDAPYDPEDDEEYDPATPSGSKPDPTSEGKGSKPNTTTSTTKPSTTTSTTTTLSTKPSTTHPTSSVSSKSSKPEAVVAKTEAIATGSGSKGPENIDRVMEKISASSNPQEISSLMVSVLARAKDSTEQQRLLATLTSRVEQQRKLKAGRPEHQLHEDSNPKEKEKKEAASHKERDIAASVTAASVTAASVTTSVTASTSVASQLPVVSASTAAVVGGSTPAVSLPATLDISSLLSAVTAAVSASKSGPSSHLSADKGAGVTETKPAEPVSRISSLTPETENMPLALKALMEDLKGNTQMTKAVDKRTERDRGKKDSAAAAKETATVAESAATPVAIDDTEADSVIPGLGGVQDVIVLQQTVLGTEEGGYVSQVKDRCDEVTSSTDVEEKGKGDNPSIAQAPPPPKVELSSLDTDLRHQAVEGKAKEGKGGGDSAAAFASSLPPHDRDDRFSSSLHPALPAPVPPPSVAGATLTPAATVGVGAGYPLPPLPPGSAPFLDDMDHRRPGHHRAMPPAPYLPSRPSAQPPPPGTEVGEEEGVGGDVDMRQMGKRPAPPLPPSASQPQEKAARLDLAPPLPPLPPQPPPPLPPLPASGGVGGGEVGRVEGGERYGRHRPHPHWQHPHHSMDSGHDYDARRSQADPYPPSHYPPPPHHQHHHHHHSRRRSSSPSPPHRYRGHDRDRDDRHRRDHHMHRDRH